MSATVCVRCQAVLEWEPESPEIVIPPGWTELRTLEGGTGRFLNAMVCEGCGGLMFGLLRVEPLPALGG